MSAQLRTVTRVALRATAAVIVLAFALSLANNSDGPNSTEAQSLTLVPTLTVTQGCTYGTVSVSWNQVDTPNNYRFHTYQWRVKRTTASWPVLGSLGWRNVHGRSHEFSTSGDAADWNIEVRAVWTFAGSGGIPFDTYGTAATAVAKGARVGCPQQVEAYQGHLNNRIRITWRPPTNTTNLGFYQYRLKLTTASSWGSWQIVPGGTTPNAIQTPATLTGGTEYDVQVRAAGTVNALNVFSTSVEDTRPGCCTPANLARVSSARASAGGAPGDIAVTWSPTSSVEIMWRDASTTPWPLTVSSSPQSGRVAAAAGTSHTLNLIPNHSYEIAVQRTGTNQKSGFSFTTARAFAVPSPTGLAIATSTTNLGELTATWDVPSPSTTTLSGFQYQARVSGGNWPGTWTAATAPAANPFTAGTEWTATITGVGTIGQEVDVRVRSRIRLTPGGGTATDYFSPPVSESETLPAPNPPTSVAVANGTNPGDISVSWTAPSATLPGSATYDGYRIRWKVGTGSTFSSWSTVAASPTNISTGLGNASHDIEIQTVVDLDGDTATTTDKAYSASASASGTSRPIASPTAPGTGVAAPDTTRNGEVHLTWVAPSSTAVQKYRYRYSVNTTPYSYSAWQETSDGTTLTATVTGLIANGNYRFQIEAVHATLGNSLPLEATAQLVLIPNSIPSAPQNFTATITTTYGQFSLAWETPQYGTSSKYQLRFKRSPDSWPGTSPNGWADITPTTSGSNHSYQIQTTGDGKKWNIELRAVDNSGLTPGVGSVASINPAVEPRQVPNPEWLQAIPGTANGSINIQWGNADPPEFNPTRFEYRRKTSAGSWSDPGATWRTITGSTSRRTLTISALTAGTDYDIEMRSVVAVSQTDNAYSLVLSANSIAATAVESVTGFSARPGDEPGQVELSWTDPAGTITNRYIRTRTESTNRWSIATELTGTSPQTILLEPGLLQFIAISVQTSTGVSGQTTSSRVAATTVKTPAMASSVLSTDTYAAAVVSIRVPSGTNQFDEFEYRQKRAEQEWPADDDEGWNATPAPVDMVSTQLIQDPDGTSGITVNVQIRTKKDIQLFGTLAPQTYYSPVIGINAPLSAVPDPTRVTAREGLLRGDLRVTWRRATAFFSGYDREGTRILYRPTGTETWQIEDKVGPGIEGGIATSHVFTFPTGWEEYEIVVQTIVQNGGANFYSPGTTRFARTTPLRATNERESVLTVEKSAHEPGEVIMSWTMPTGFNVEKYRVRYSKLDDRRLPDWRNNWMDVETSLTSTTISDLELGQTEVRYRFQLQAVHAELGATRPLEDDVRFDPLPVPHDFTVYMSPGTATLQWDDPPRATAHAHRYRYRRTADPDIPSSWSEWTVEGIEYGPHDEEERNVHRVYGLDHQTSYTFELQSVYNIRSFGQSIFRDGQTLIDLPLANRIEPQIRSVTIPAGQQVRLEVNVYGMQDNFANGKFNDDDNTFLDTPYSFAWSDGNAGGSFDGNTRRVMYTAPSTPSSLRITAEFGPPGICRGHHLETPDFDDCRTTINVRVTRAPIDPGKQPDPVNPAGTIPTSLTDADGNAYEVVTPVDGGTFNDTENNVTISAPEGAVPDQTLIGIRSVTTTVDATTVTHGASMTLANTRTRITATDAQGNQLSGYRLQDPIQACVPLPDEFRTRLDTARVIQFSEAIGDNSITVLTAKVFNNAAQGLRICAAVTQLPATIAPARLGVAPLPPTPVPTDSLSTIDAGGTAPTATWLALLLAASIAIAITATAIFTRRLRSRRHNLPA